MLIGDDGQPALPWLAAPLQQALARSRGHALLLHGAAGSGAREFGLALAQSWLCEAAAASEPPRLACGRCAACRLVQAHVHPDLLLLAPEEQRLELDWPLPGDKAASESSSKKPSRQIRVDEVRGMVEWVFKTSGRGRGKVVVITPGEALNVQAANALLKTLEEPPAGTRLVLSAADPSRLLPTVRSRCQALRLADPAPDAARAWLASQGVAEPELLLAASSGRPLDALALHRAGVTAEAWARLPAALAAGQGAALQGWPLPQTVDTLLKLCHDAMAAAAGAPTRYFPHGSVPKAASMAALREWSTELTRLARHAGHPWNEAVLLDALVAAAARALAAPPQATSARPPPRPGGMRFDTLPA